MKSMSFFFSSTFWTFHFEVAKKWSQPQHFTIFRNETERRYMQISILKHSDFGVNLSGFFNWRKFTWEQFICLPMFSFQSNYSTPLASICFKWYMVLIAFFCWKRDFAYQFEFFFIGSGPEGVEKNLLTSQNHSRANLFRSQFIPESISSIAFHWALLFHDSVAYSSSLSIALQMQRFHFGWVRFLSINPHYFVHFFSSVLFNFLRQLLLCAMCILINLCL